MNVKRVTENTEKYPNLTGHQLTKLTSWLTICIRMLPAPCAATDTAQAPPWYVLRVTADQNFKVQKRTGYSEARGFVEGMYRMLRLVLPRTRYPWPSSNPTARQQAKCIGRSRVPRRAVPKNGHIAHSGDQDTGAGLGSSFLQACPFVPRDRRTRGTPAHQKIRRAPR